MDPAFERFDEVMLFRQTLTPETDRGVALVCASYLDEALKGLLMKFFITAPRVTGKLFEGGTAPLATFSARIDLAFVVGLIPKESHRGLHLIRKIRNSFAHEYQARQFRDDDISARCKELRAHNIISRDERPRALFIRACMGILATIHAQSYITKHSQQAPPQCLDDHQLKDSELHVALRAALQAVMKELTPQQLASLKNRDAGIAERRRLILEALQRVLPKTYGSD